MDRRQTAVEAKLLPRFQLARIRKRQKTFEPLLERLADRSVSGEAFQALLSDIHDLMPAGVRRDSLMGPLSILTTRAHTATELAAFSWRLAAAVGDIEKDRATTLLPGTARDGWCALRVVDVFAIASRGGKLYKLIGFVEAGPWAGGEVSLAYSGKGLFVLAVNIGYSRFHEPLRYHQPWELFGMELTGYVRGTDYGPWVAEYGASSGQQQRNRSLIKARRQPCQRGLTITCGECEKGLEECPLATRQKSLYLAICGTCQLEAYHDARHPKACLDCRVRHVHKRLKELSNG
ncbi:MAG: hypothetical protein WC992_00410 [Acholeplasmataceae bacterium]